MLEWESVAREVFAGAIMETPEEEGKRFMDAVISLVIRGTIMATITYPEWALAQSRLMAPLPEIDTIAELLVGLMPVERMAV